MYNRRLTVYKTSNCIFRKKETNHKPVKLEESAKDVLEYLSNSKFYDLSKQCFLTFKLSRG